MPSAIYLLHHGRQVYEGRGELHCHENGDGPHPWEVSFRISSAEIKPWAELHMSAAPIRVAFDGRPSAQAILEGLLTCANGARVLLRGAGLCPHSSHAAPRHIPASA